MGGYWAASIARFDFNKDGTPERTSWLGGEDGFVAYDANGDGRISGAAELAFKSYLPTAKTDLEGLRAFDSNGDNLLSAADAQWGRFGIWQDGNENGVQEAGEFTTMAERKIDSINLTSDQQLYWDSHVTIFGRGRFSYRGKFHKAWRSGISTKPSFYKGKYLHNYLYGR